MAAVAHANKKGMYSWWWHSHISPKNSKWLQENLTDMDMKVKQMIKLLEEDADSFARRAEMYYKKRPELMKLVEEFYRAYHALAERYDHATGVLRQAQKTMAEAFPNQVPSMLSDDSAPEFDPQTPEISFASRNGGFSEDSNSITSKKGLKQFNSGLFGSGEGRVRRGLNFHDSNEKQDLRDEEEIESLKKDLARLEAEKEAGIVQYQQSLEESKKFSEQVEQAEAEVRSLQESITRLEEEKNESLLKYQRCLDKIGEMENLMSESKERAYRIEAEAEALKGDLVKIEAEKEAALGKYKECLEVISGLEEKLRKAEAEVESLKEELSKLMETISGLGHKLSLAEEETQRLRLEIDDRTEKLRISEERYLTLENLNQTLLSELETRSRELVEKQNEVGNLWTCVQEERTRFVEAETAFQTLQHLHSQSLEELRSLAVDIQSRNQILKDTEAQNKNLQGEVERILDENRNLNEVNLSSSLTVKNLQEEILSLREMIQKLEQEIELRVDERNALQQEIYCLKEEVNGLNEKNRGLEEQVDSETSEKVVLLEKLAAMEKLIEKNLLLENSLSDLNVELEEVREKVKALEESCKILLGEKDSLNSQLNIMTQKFEKLEEKNNLLENSLCDANAEAEAFRVKSKSLEDSCLSLGEEKSGLVAERESLVSQLNESQESMKDLEKRFQELEEIHAFVEKEKESILLEMDKLNKTLNAEREEYSGIIKSSKAQICVMESQILLLQQEAACRNNEYEEELDKNMHFQTEIFILQKSMEELKEKILSLSFNCQKLVEASNLSDKQISHLENRNLEQQVELKALTDQLNEYSLWLYEVFGILDINTTHGFEHKMDRETVERIIQKVKELQTEIFILQNSMKESEEKISALSLNCQKLVDASHNSEKQISHLESKNLEQQVELKSLTDHINKLRLGLYEVFGVLKNGKNGSVHKTEIDQEVGGLIMREVKELQNSLTKVEEENLLGAIQKSVLDTLLRQTEVEAADLWAEKCALDQNIRNQTEELRSLQRELEIVLEMSEELRLKVLEGICREEVLNSEMKILHERLTSTEAAFERLKEENCAVLKERHWLEEEGHILFGEKLSRATVSVILEEVVRQNFVALKELAQELEKVHSVNGELHQKIILMECNLENIRVEKLELECMLEKSENEVRSVTSVNEQLNCEITKEKEILGQFEKKLSEATETINSTENKKFELEKELEVLKEEYGSVFGKLLVSEVRETLFEEKIHECEDELEKKLSEAAHTINVTANKKCELEKELRVLNEEYGSVLGKLIVSEVRETLFEEKIHESEDELEKKLSEASEMINVTENKKCELEKELRGLKEEYGSVLGKLIVSEVCETLFVEKIRESEDEFERKLSEASQTINVTMNKKCELEKELRVLKEEYGSVLCKLIASEVREMLFEGKIHESEDELEKKLSEAAETINRTENKKCELEKELLVLKEEYGSVLGKSIVSEVREMLFEEKIHECEDELEKVRESSGMEMGILEKKAATLEGENGDLNAKLAAHLSALASLRDCVVSLESSLNQDKQNKAAAQGVEDLEPAHDLERRLKGIEMALLEKLARLEGPSSSPMPETAAGEGRALTKDIMLDQASECSSYGISRRGTLGPDDHQVLELWDRNGGSTLGFEARKEHRSLNPSTDSLVDKLDFSETFSETQSVGGGKRRVKVLERLDSDVQKLTNLQITLEDLKKKVEAVERNKKGEMGKGKGFGYDSLKGQLGEVEAAIARLFNENRRLAKNLEEDHDEIDGTGVSRRRFSEQARRGSERLGRIQLELQRIQFLLLKLEDGSESKERSKVMEERSKRVLLRDYLYGSGPRTHNRTDPRRKKAHFCACAPKVIE